MTSQGPITFHDVVASFSEEQWMCLDNSQKEVYRNVMKDIHGTLLARGYTILNPSTAFHIKGRNESFVRVDSHCAEMESSVDGDFPDILMKIKEEPIVGETQISQGDHCVIYNPPSTFLPPKSSNTALIKEEEEGFSIDDYNRAGEEGTSSNSAGVPGIFKQEPDDGKAGEAENEDHENIIPVIVKQEEPEPGRNYHNEETQPAHLSASSGDPIDSLIDAAILLVVLRRRRRLRELEEKRSRRRYQTHPLTSQRLTNTLFATIYRDLRKYPKRFFNFTQMSVSTFDALLEILRPRLSPSSTNMWRSVSAEERLLVTLRFLATGQSFASLHHYFQLGVSTVAKVTHETCQALWEELHQVVMPKPKKQLWKDVEDEFWMLKDFPNCIGALGCRHVRLKMPPNVGSKHSKNLPIVVLGLVDAYYRFIGIDVGAYGTADNSNLFRESTMGRSLYEGQLKIPPKKPLPCTTEPNLPHVIVADETFGLTENLMCPYSGHELAPKERTFNYRLSQARQVVDCAFEVCTSKWRILWSEMQLDVENAMKVVRACCVLYNFVLERERRSSYPVPRNTAQDVPVMDLQPTNYAINVRNAFANFFVSPEGKGLFAG
ncbi:uncharacterized protein LOC143934379 isoform X1 [Lithobates pipiens]